MILKRQKRLGSNRYRHYYSILVIFWGIILSAFILTEDLESLLLYKNIDFMWIQSPNFSSFFNFYDITIIHSWWFLVKGGHFLGFAILMLLIYLWLRTRFIAAVLAIMFAAFTEILQLFFGRDGRLYDIFINSSGVITALLLLNICLLLRNNRAIKTIKSNKKINDYHRV